ncbi:uncharacterized protein LOC118736242 [Rhagoletis pomonella]|uniref:uncharacterized protein LOC118736242 n=1 Tax=Rhagoletis pomonella TaxID=28610 RepID=UPI00177EB2D2|nr:uncharacterized protein LOC118736242 [Rhagoletis pomonella]
MSETRKKPEPQKCRLCGQRHVLRQCRAFLAMKPEERYECARTHRYCINCLAVSHTTGACDSASSCRQCSLGHHTLLRQQELRRLVAEAKAALDKLDAALKSTTHQGGGGGMLRT